MRFIIVPDWRDSGPGRRRIQGGGHISIESGHGEWPPGVALLQSPAGDLGITSRLHPPFSSSPFSPSSAPLETV